MTPPRFFINQDGPDWIVIDRENPEYQCPEWRLATETAAREYAKTLNHAYAFGVVSKPKED